MNVPKNIISKRDKEDQRKKEEEQKTAEVLKDFVATFEGSKSSVKTFIRGDVINPDLSSKIYCTLLITICIFCKAIKLICGSAISCQLLLHSFMQSFQTI